MTHQFDHAIYEHEPEYTFEDSIDGHTWAFGPQQWLAQLVPDEIHVPTADDVSMFVEVDSMSEAMYLRYPSYQRYESKGEH